MKKKKRSIAMKIAISYAQQQKIIFFKYRTKEYKIKRKLYLIFTFLNIIKTNETFFRKALKINTVAICSFIFLNMN